MKSTIKNGKPVSKKVVKLSDQPPVSLDDEITEQPASSKPENEVTQTKKQEEKPDKQDEATRFAKIEDDEPFSSLTGDLVARQEQRQARSGAVSTAIVFGLLAGLVGGALGSTYLAPWIQKNLNIQAPVISNELRKVTLDENSAVIDVVKNANPAVVSIIISKDLPKVQQYYFDPFSGVYLSPNGSSSSSGQTVKQQIGAGSGFLVSSDGLIMTNKHVVEDDKAEYTVITQDGKKYAGRVVAKDPLNDLAVVKIDAKDMPILQFGDSGNLQLGQGVIAIGNTLGQFSNTVTTGVVSGIGRTVSADSSTGSVEQLQQVIQTDAAINPGNSGGPLLNLAGLVIGVNTAIDQSGQLVGFAIPASEAKKVLDDVKKFGKVMRAFLGIRYVMITADLAQAQKLPVDYGALIEKGDNPGNAAIVAGSAAEKAGLKEGDIILEVNSKKVTQDNTLSSVLKGYNPNDQIVLKIQRGKDIKEILVTLGQAS